MDKYIIEILAKLNGETTEQKLEHLKKLLTKEKKPNKISIEERKSLFIDKCIALYLTNDFDFLQEFISYWTESNENGKKMRFEMQKVFDVKRRFNTFLTNKKKWQNNGKKQSNTETALKF